MTAPGPAPRDLPGSPPVPLAEAFWFWVWLGFVNFGGPTGQISLMHTEATVELRLSFPAALDFTQEDVQRGVLLGRAALAPLEAQLAFGQDPAGGSHIKLKLPMDSNETPR